MFFLLYKIGRILTLTLPLKVNYNIADISGSLYYLLAKRDRKVVSDNLKVILKHTENVHKLAQTSRLVFVNFARYLVEFFRTPKIDLKYIQENVKVEGKDNLNQALKLGKGVLLVSAHLGNWELGAMILSMLGYRINIIAWTHKNKLTNDFFLRLRQSKGVHVIPLGTALRGVFSALRNNENVALLGDIDYTQPEVGVTVKLFGRDTIMPRGPAAFSLKTGAAIVPTFVLREKNNTFRLVLEKPITYKPSGNWESDLTSLTQELTRILESYIVLDPGQWFMLRPRWSSG